MSHVFQSRNEPQVIAAILGGESQLFHDLIRPYKRRVFLMALSFLHNEADAEDVAQDAFLKAFRNLKSFRGESQFGSWLISITLNEARSLIRRKKLVLTRLLEVPLNEHAQSSLSLLCDWNEIPSETLERQDMRLMLQEAVASLPIIYRETFVLHHIEEMSIAQTAEMLEVTPVNVKVRLHRARKMLQKTLAAPLKRINPKKRWLQW